MRPRVEGAAFKVAATYLVAAVLWIVLSDRVVLAVTDTVEHTVAVETAKGIGFVIASAIVIYLLVRRALRRQRAAQKERDAVLEVVNDGVWTFDGSFPQGRFNARLCELLGETGDSIDTSWTAWRERIHPDDRPGIEAMIAAIERNETDIYDHVHRLARRDGTWLWVRARGRVVERAANGTPLRAVGTYTDITPLKEKEAALSRMVRELSRSRAEIERFGFAVAHDLREPVRMVGSYAGLLNRRYGDTLSAEGVDYLRYIQEGAHRLDSMLHRLLDSFTQREAPTPFTNVDLSQVIDEVIEKLADPIARSGARLNFGILPVVRGDPVQLAILMENLLGNALKFRKPAVPPKIELIVHRTEGGWRITVCDNGVGFPPGDAEAIFNAFYCAHPRADYPGAGMGLAICRAIVEHHNGVIEADSTPDSGTRIHVTLPAATKEDGAAARSAVGA